VPISALGPPVVTASHRRTLGSRAVEVTIESGRTISTSVARLTLSVIGGHQRVDRPCPCVYGSRPMPR
jgi:hypothetical protein